MDKWDGLTPLVIGSADKLMLQPQELDRLRQSRENANPTQNNRRTNAP